MSQQGKETRAFLHNVIYIPAPIIRVANAARGIKIKKLVLRPIKQNTVDAYKIVTVLINCNGKSTFSFWIL
ncbi:hypothetical protein C6989_09510 [Nitrosopumilus sp. b2]|nr:hypothetical protein C6989_09510 [Nitrosopumilus sp. b2]